MLRSSVSFISLQPLSKEHPVGKHKAIVFESTIGFKQIDSEKLRIFILNAIRETDAQYINKDFFGERYIVDLTYKTIKKIYTIRTSWIVLADENNPRLTSCYVKL